MAHTPSLFSATPSTTWMNYFLIIVAFFLDLSILVAFFFLPPRLVGSIITISGKLAGLLQYNLYSRMMKKKIQ
jgi:hypothetical protein